MKELLAELNPEQREVALERSHCLAVACPGSGKTKTLATKAALLLNEGARLAAVTFTRDAALELRERIVALAGPGCKSRLLVGTFHSIDMLMAFPGKHSGEFGRAVLAGMKTPFTKPWNIIKEGVRRGYLIRAIREAGLKIPRDEASSLIELYKASPSAVVLDDQQRIMVEHYVALMEESRQIDFQDIILNTNAALKNKTLSPLGVDFLLIDEFQDTDQAQYEWAAHHGRAGISTTVVGDDDQSIYAFRRALGYEGMDKFAREFNAHRVLLGSNYRCRAEILSAAETLIRRNTQRIDKILHAAKGQGGFTQWESFKDEESENVAVVVEAKIALDEGATFAVIARTNRELIGIETQMLAKGVPFRKNDGRSIFECPEVQVFAALLRTLIKPVPNDVDQVLAWAGMTEADTREVRRMFGMNIRIGSTVDFQNSKVTKEGVEIWRHFAKKHTEWTSAAAAHLYDGLIFGVFEWLGETLQKPHQYHILEAAKVLFEVRDRDKGNTLADHLNLLRNLEMTIRAESKGNGQPADPKKVAWLMTAHGSKGLEFDRVWLVGLKTGSFPSEKSSLEEERRLMYVAMTRAREMLWVSATRDKKPSVFVIESGLLNPERTAA